MNPKLGHYKTILADPPWAFQTYSEKGKGMSAEQHYPCMTIDDIMTLPVASWAAADAVLLLWVTKPMLTKAHDVIRAWGFTYKTVGFTWVKTIKSGGFRMSLGYWTRGNPESCLLFTRGSPRRRSASHCADGIRQARRDVRAHRGVGAVHRAVREGSPTRMGSLGKSTR